MVRILPGNQSIHQVVHHLFPNSIPFLPASSHTPSPSNNSRVFYLFFWKRHRKSRSKGGIALWRCHATASELAAAATWMGTANDVSNDTRNRFRGPAADSDQPTPVRRESREQGGVRSDACTRARVRRAQLAAVPQGQLATDGVGK